MDLGAVLGSGAINRGRSRRFFPSTLERAHHQLCAAANWNLLVTSFESDWLRESLPRHRVMILEASAEAASPKWWFGKLGLTPRRVIPCEASACGFA